MAKLLDLTGQHFGRLTVLAREGATRAKKATWKCACSCGGQTTSTTGALRSGHVTSCGCAQLQANFIHGMARLSPGRHPLYRSWMSMISRCTRPADTSYANYGGRGVQVCERWRTPKNFILDMLPSWKPGLTLDRIDTNGNYCLKNCRWATRSEQQRNRKVCVWVQTPHGVLQQVDALILWSRYAVDKFPRVPKPT